MKVYSLSVLSVTSGTPAQATLLGTAQDLASFSFYQRGSVGEFMTFFTKVRERRPSSLSSETATDLPPDCRRAHASEPAFVGRGEQLQGACFPGPRPHSRRARFGRCVFPLAWPVAMTVTAVLTIRQRL